MAAVLKSLAAEVANKSSPSSFYGTEKPNPVLQALDKEIIGYVVYMKKRASTGYRPSHDEAISRPADMLFALWNKYEPSLSKYVYQSKLLEMGDFLVSIKEYNLALWQCYGRYMKSFGDVNVEEITEMAAFKQAFFPDGFDAEDAGFTFRALMGKSICSYQTVRQQDPKLQNADSVEKCLHILNFLRLVTQVILPKERLCWLVYNGTIHIYSISRHLMSLGHSSKVLEFVLWASMCMESSVPLLGVRYLSWRATLYTAVCQCYYDCKTGQSAEAYARRALSKINELSQLESISSSRESLERELIFREATIKMGIMIYKRTVFETRKKPKGLLRPKTRANLKDASQLPWPRTQSEKLLSDMFEGSAAQMLCLLETMSDSNKRTLITAPPAPDSEVEILDVFGELFMAAQEIIAGGGGYQGTQTAQKGADIRIPGMAGIIPDKTLLQLAVRGKDGVAMKTVVKVVKWSYCYEQWDYFDTWLEPTINALKELNDARYGPDGKALEILRAYDRVVTRNKQRKLFHSNEVDEETGQEQHVALSSPRPKEHDPSKTESSGGDPLIHLAEVLLSIVNGPYSQDAIDIDMVVDGCLALWTRCKAVFQKYQSGSTDNPKYLQKMENPSKWVYILDIVLQVLGWCGLSSVDPALTAEVVLRLALVFEASAALDTDNKSKSGRSKFESTIKTRDFDEDQSMISSFKEVHASRRNSTSVSEGSRDQPVGASHTSVFSSSMLNHSVRDQLILARDILELGLDNVSYARSAVARTNGTSVADVSWHKELNKELFQPAVEKSGEKKPGKRDEAEVAVSEEEPDESKEATAVWNTVRDLNLELIFMYHRVCVKLASLGPEPTAKSTSKKFKRKSNSSRPDESREQLTNPCVDDFDELLICCRRNNLSKSLLFMHKAVVSVHAGLPPTEQNNLLQEALSLIKKAEVEEKRLYTDNVTVDSEPAVVKETKLPPPPILLCRTDTSMTFKPAPFNALSHQKVAWYRIFARSATGSNVKVRLGDYFLEGTGQQVPSFRCELTVSGLLPSDKYVFAVAAYTKDGKLIGGSIGESTRPILASHPLPILMTWAYLCQVSYQVGCYGITKEACTVLWKHFVAEPPPPDSMVYTSKAQDDFSLVLHRLNQKVVSVASPVLLRMFLTSIFINVDVHVREGELFCDSLCDRGPPNTSQICRMRQCEKMLVALELAGWLNESNQALQAVVQCYGLVTPLIHFKIPSVPVIQILERCLAILLEIPASLRQKRMSSISDSLHHMTACITYHMAKVLRNWNQRALAGSVNDMGRKLLRHSTEKTSDHALGLGEDNDADQETETGALTLATLKKKKTPKKGYGAVAEKEETESGGNEELKALEAHMLRLSKQAQGEHELSGNEDPTILHAYIAYLPSRIAYKEVYKFRRRACYLEYFVQVAQKALQEGLPDLASDWCDDTVQWLNKRNDQILGSRVGVGKQPGAVTILGDDPKKYAAAMVEYSKDKPEQTKSKLKAGSSQIKHKKGKNKYKTIGITPNMSDAQKTQQEDIELKALDVLSLYLVDMYNNKTRMRKVRKLSSEEMPWRAQLNIVLGLSQFGVFLNKLDTNEKLRGTSPTYLYESSFLDLEWFSFETAGTLLVGMNRDQLSRPGRSLQQSPHGEADVQDKDTAKTGVDRAAAAVTGKPPPPRYLIPPEEEDTPRTYRSEDSPPRHKSDRKNKREKEVIPKIMKKEEDVDILKATFKYFKRALILAHRGRHWTLLQNACRALWNCEHGALNRCRSPSESGECFLEADSLRALVWDVFHTAADCLLDMLIELHKQQEKTKKKKDLSVDGFSQVRSWMGDIEDEKGGASLKFESPLDDVSTVDMRWVKRIVLRVLELLYLEGKWERLVDIALRFNAVSDDRYAEQVNPLLVQAQRILISRISEHGGRPPPQPHFVKAQEELQRPITATAYATLQLRVLVKEEDLSDIDPGAHIDPVGHDIYSGGSHAMKLCCVPLDVYQSLQSLRSTLSKCQYTARALQHSRRLLILYLAGQMTGIDCQQQSGVQSRVDFAPNTARPHLTVPIELSEELFMSADDVQSVPLPKSQLTMIMSSYKKTIEMLRASGQKGLVAEAMRELGNLHYHVEDHKGALKWWADSLDLLLNTTNAIHNWREVLKVEDISSALLTKCGLWGCVLGGIICSNIAQYILPTDLGLRTECCFLSGYFFKALFRASEPHPKADRDYALYEVGEGCEVAYLVPGIDLLSERFRCDGRTMVAALRFVMGELARGRHNLFVLPLLTLYQYFATSVCRNLQRAVDGRILKVRILTDLALYTEAFTTLQRLLQGERLPHTADSHFIQVDNKWIAYSFNTSKPLLDPANIKVLESMIHKNLSTTLSALYGSYLTCCLSIAQAHLLIAVASSIPVLPKFEENSAPGSSLIVQPPNTTIVARPTSSNTQRRSLSAENMKLSVSPTRKPSRVDEETSRAETASSAGAEKDVDDVRRKLAGAKTTSLEMMKGTLLTAADSILTGVSETIIENAQQDAGVHAMSASELEVVVNCRLELAAIARERHHAPMATRVVLSAMKMMQNAAVFSDSRDSQHIKKVTKTSPDGMMCDSGVQKETGPNQYQNFQSRSRLDVRLWLTCRLALVRSIMLEIQGMGQIKGPPQDIKVEVVGAEEYCLDGVTEAETCGDLEMQAEFLLEKVKMNLQQGRPIQQTKQLLQEIDRLLCNISQLSPPAQLLKTEAFITWADLEAVEPSTSTSPLVVNLQRYKEGQLDLLQQIKKLGESIEHRHDLKTEYSTLTSPIQNLYLPHLLPLVQIKLRIGHAMARLAAMSRNTSDDDASIWTAPLGVLMTGLEISQVIGRRTSSLEAEILLNIGKLQRQLYHVGKCHQRRAAATLLEAIHISYANDHDLGLMRQGYLELAVLYLTSSGVISLKDGTSPEARMDSEDDLGTSSRDSIRVKKKKSKTRKSRERLVDDDKSQERRAASMAIRCAAAVGQAERASVLLVGDPRVTSDTVGTKVQDTLPEFLVLDLLGYYVLGERKRVYKNEIEEELAPLTESLEPPPVQTYQDQIREAREAAFSLSWTHILGYQAILQRLCSTATLTAEITDQKPTEHSSGDLGPEFDLGVISRAQYDVSVNHDVVRSMLFSPSWTLRLNYLHQFLTQQLPAYANECSAIYPPEALHLPVPDDTQLTEVELICKTYAGNLIAPDDSSLDPVCPGPPGTQTGVFIPTDKALFSPSENALSLQWYLPSLDEYYVTERSVIDLDTSRGKAMLLYAMCSKRAERDQCGMMWLQHAKVIDLHDRLSVATQRAEISLVDKPKKEPSQTSITPVKGRKQARIKPLSPKVKRDQHLESLLRQCMSDAVSLLGHVPEEAKEPLPSTADESKSKSSLPTESERKLPEIPFEVNKKVVHDFEKIFDPSYGSTLKESKLLTWFSQMFPW